MTDSESDEDRRIRDTMDDSSLGELVRKYFGPVLPVVKAQFGALSHPGLIRANNEDHYAVVCRRRSRDVLLTNLPKDFLPQSADESYSIVVADGVGGAAFGELASMFALRRSWDLTGSAFKWHFKMTDAEFKELEEMVQVYGQLIHKNLVERGDADRQFAGMGTTITAALTFGVDAVIAHAGDSRAYLFRNGTVKQLTRDHTMAQQMVDEGQIESLSDAPRVLKNMLTNFLGGRSRKSVDVDVCRVRLTDGDWLVLCSDGLTDVVNDEEIAQLLSLDSDPQTSCQRLVNAALEAGGSDNVTVVCGRFAVSN